MIDRTILELSRSKHEYRARCRRRSRATRQALLFVTFFGDTVEEARAKLDKLGRRQHARPRLPRCAPRRRPSRRRSPRSARRGWGC